MAQRISQWRFYLIFLLAAVALPYACGGVASTDDAAPSDLTGQGALDALTKG